MWELRKVLKTGVWFMTVEGTFKLLEMPIFWIYVTLPIVRVMKFIYIMNIQYLNQIVAPKEAVHEPEVVTIDDEVEIVVDVVNENLDKAEIDVNEGISVIEGEVYAKECQIVNEDQTDDEAQKCDTDEDSKYIPSYFSKDDETFMEVDLDDEIDLGLKPSKRRNKRPTEGQGMGINVEENVVSKNNDS